MRRGFSEETTQILLSSLQDSTLKQYEKAINLWWNFCREANTSIFEMDTIKITEFLTDSQLRNKSYSTLNTYRAALSLLDMNDIGKDQTLSRFFKGLSVQKPQTPKYDSIWDPEPVINFLEKQHPNESISMEMLTKKLVTLLALISAQRVQTISKILVENVEIFENYIQIKVPDRVKTSGRNRNQPLINIPVFKDQPKICVASVMETYLQKTSGIRNECKKLFITYKKPYHEASSQSISRWIKATLQASGIDTKIFTAHSTRHAATSAAARNGINIETIRKTAGWTEKSTVFTRFYNRPLAASRNFASAVLRK